MMFDSQTIVTGHGAVRYSDTGGPGFPLLLVHGSSLSRRVFARQFDSDLSRRWRLIAIDLPGHGESEDARDPQVTYTPAGFAECLEEVAERLDLQRLAVFGWSLGGHVAIEWLSRSTRPCGLVLSGAPPMPRGFLGMFRAFQPSLDLLLVSKQQFSDRDAARFVSLCFGSARPAAFQDLVLRADGRVRSVFAHALSRGDGADQRRTIEASPVPVAFVNGSDDPFVRLGYFSNINVPELFGHEPLVIEGAGHAPFWERAELFNPILDRFLGRVASESASDWQAQARPAAARGGR